RLAGTGSRGAPRAGATGLEPWRHPARLRARPDRGPGRDAPLFDAADAALFPRLPAAGVLRDALPGVGVDPHLSSDIPAGDAVLLGCGLSRRVTRRSSPPHLSRRPNRRGCVPLRPRTPRRAGAIVAARRIGYDM